MTNARHHWGIHLTGLFPLKQSGLQPVFDHLCDHTRECPLFRSLCWSALVLRYAPVHSWGQPRRHSRFHAHPCFLHGNFFQEHENHNHVIFNLNFSVIYTFLVRLIKLSPLPQRCPFCHVSGSSPNLGARWVNVSLTFCGMTCGATVRGGPAHAPNRLSPISVGLRTKLL